MALVPRSSVAADVLAGPETVQQFLSALLLYYDTQVLYYQCSTMTCTCHQDTTVHQSTFADLVAAVRGLVDAFVHTAIWPPHALPMRALINRRYGTVIQLVLGVTPNRPATLLLHLDVGLDYAASWQWVRKPDMVSEQLVHVHLARTLWFLIFKAMLLEGHAQEDIVRWFKSVCGTTDWKVHHPWLREAMATSVLAIVPPPMLLDHDDEDVYVLTPRQTYMNKYNVPEVPTDRKLGKCYDCRKVVAEFECCDETYFCFACILQNHTGHAAQTAYVYAPPVVIVV